MYFPKPPCQREDAATQEAARWAKEGPSVDTACCGSINSSSPRRVMSGVQERPVSESAAADSRQSLLSQDVSTHAAHRFLSRCETCVGRLFGPGAAPCPVCHTTLTKSNFFKPTFSDLEVEKEVRIRRIVLQTFNKREEDFEDLRAYNDYLEEVEDIGACCCC